MYQYVANYSLKHFLKIRCKSVIVLVDPVKTSLKSQIKDFEDEI